MTKQKEQKFIQLGLKRKGRIVKNEQYSIEEFVYKIDRRNTGGRCLGIQLPKIGLLKRLSKTKFNLEVLRGLKEGYQQALDDIKIQSNALIDADEFGKKRRTKK